MKKRIDRYRWASRLERFFIILIAVEGIGVIGKGAYIHQKMKLVKSGLVYYEKEAWLEAEEQLQNANAHSYFTYDQKKVNEALGNLKWITNSHQQVQALYGALVKSEKENDYELFTKTLAQYKALDIEQLEPYQKAYYESKFPINQKMKDGWTQFKGYMQIILEKPYNKEQYVWAKKHINEVPQAYFTKDKVESIRTLFERCDDQLFYKVPTSQGDLTEKLKAINEIYELNEQCGYQTEWLKDKVQAYLRNLIGEKALPAEAKGLQEVKWNPKEVVRNAGDTERKEQLQKFFDHSENQIHEFSKVINDYETLANRHYYDEHIRRLVDNYVTQKQNEIQVLVEAKYYDEAIKWYEALKDLGDFSQEIKALESAKVFNDPVALIEDHLADYVFYEVGRSGLGADEYLLAGNTQTNELELYQIMGDEKENSHRMLSIKIEQLGITVDEFSALKEREKAHLQIIVQGQLIGISWQNIIEGLNEEKQKLVVLEAKDQELRGIFSKTGLGVSMSADLMQLMVMSPEDEDVEGTYQYRYEDGGYTKEERHNFIDQLGEEVYRNILEKGDLFGE